MPHLTGPRLKLRRAHEHLDDLGSRERVYLAGKPYSTSIEPNADGTKLLLRMRIQTPVPPDFGLLIGDVAHNARSALDHVIASISSVTGPAREKLQFPIVTAPKAYGEQISRGRLEGVTGIHRTSVERFQPYKRSGSLADDPLKMLAEINNTDKHRLIVPVGTRGFRMGMRLGDGPYHEPGMTFSNAYERLDSEGNPIGIISYDVVPVGDGVISEDGTVIAEMGMPPTKVTVKAYAFFEVKFGPSCPGVQGRSVIETLTFILDRVEEVIRDFE